MVALSDPSSMNLSSLFSSNRRKSTDTPRQKKDRGKSSTPRLDRSNASRYIEYEAEAFGDHCERRPSSGSDSVFCTRYLEVPWDKTSFRINGVEDGEVETLCRSLGLSGPEEFAVDLDAWESRKSLQARCDGVDNCLASNPVADELIEAEKGEEVLRGEADGVGGGIRGVRPPMLAPPPFRSFPAAEDVRTAWDLVRSFGPQHANGGGGSGGSEDDVALPVSLLAHGRGDATTSWSFTTINDDDCSSTTTDFSISPNMRYRWQPGEWTKGKELGRGSFGTVYEAIGEGGFFFAVKEVSLLGGLGDARQSIEQLEQEIILLSQFEHENIVRYLGTEKIEDKFYIFLELVTQGSLVSLYNKYHLRDSQASSYTWQILNGLQYLHDRNVVHRDIKCANILVDASGLAKLADFGLAKQTTRFDLLKSCRGSVYWMAPEVVKPDQSYGPPADIWSLGCTVLEMLTRKPPYMSEQNPSYEQDWVRTFYLIGKGVKPDIPDSLSPHARDFINQCIQVNPDDRPSAAHLLCHPFVKRLSAFASPGSPYCRRT